MLKLHRYIGLSIHPCRYHVHSSPFPAFLLLKCFLPSTMAPLFMVIMLAKTHTFGLFGTGYIQVIGRQAPSAAIYHQSSNPNPLPGHLTQFSLL